MIAKVSVRAPFSINISIRHNAMGRIFDGGYVRMDDDVSFQIVRTNPLLTTNTKLMYDGERMFLESYDASPLLTTQKYKNVALSGSSPFNRDIRNFLLGTHDVAYDVCKKESDMSICDRYDKQFETTYWCGVEGISSKGYPQGLGFIAPIYLRKKIPNYFVIFRVDGPSNFNLNTDSGTGKPVDADFDFRSDITGKARVVKSFSMKEGTVIGDYIRKYVGQPGFEFDRSVHVNVSSNEITYYGIDKQYGVLTSKKENFRTELMENDNTVLHSDEWVTGGFRRNGLIFPYIINIEFLFDDPDTKDYEFARYFGLYCNDIDLFDFEMKYRDTAGTLMGPDEIPDSMVVSAPAYGNIRILTDNTGDTGVFGFRKDDGEASFRYMKDKSGGLHQVEDMYDNYYDNDGTKVLEISDRSVDLGLLCGFEVKGVSVRCERLAGSGKRRTSFTVRKKFGQGESITFTKNGNAAVTFVAVGEDDTNPIPAGGFVGTKFSIAGSVADMVKALCGAINSADAGEHLFDAAYDGTCVVLTSVSSGAGVAIDNSIVANGRVRHIQGVPTPSDDGEFRFMIDAADRDVFVEGRSLKTSSGMRNATIVSCVPHVTDDGRVDSTHYEVSTDGNGAYVSISNTGMVEIVDPFRPKFGILGFFPVRDFNFDTVFSNYGSNTPFLEECKALEKVSEGMAGPGENYERGSLTTLAEGYLKDSDGRPIETEYEYFMENLVPELAVVGKSVPHIVKWGYYDEQKDSCENPYRLNMSKIFGTSNLSANTYTQTYSINEHTHSMPYYVTTDPSLCGGGNYQYVYDNVGIYDNVGRAEGQTLYDTFVGKCVDIFMDTETDNFDKLLSYKTKSDKRFVRKYSRMDFGGGESFASTLFRGVRFVVKRTVDDNEIPGGEYNGYRFAFLYIPVELPSIYVSNKVYFVKNDMFGFIIGFIVVNTVSSGYVTGGGDESDAGDEQYLCSRYGLKDFCKAYVYGGCYGLLSLPVVSHDGEDGGTVTITNMPFTDVFGVRMDTSGNIDVQRMSVTNQSVRVMLENLDSPDSIDSIVIHNLDNTVRYRYTNIKNSECVVYVVGHVVSTKLRVGDTDMFVDITFKDRVDSVTNESVMFEGFYKVFESVSAYNIKENINDGPVVHDGMVVNNVAYHSTSGDTYKMSIEEPTSVGVYDIFTSTPRSVAGSGTDTICCSDITLKNNVNDICLKVINRYSGYYNPIFNDILMYDDYVLSDVTYKFSNTVLDTGYSDIYGTFGKVRNMWFHKVNEDCPDRIITMSNPVYPAIGQFALDYRDYNVFESTWDDMYYTTQVDLNTSRRCPGTAGVVETPAMFGGKRMKVPDEITIDTMLSCSGWDDGLIMDDGYPDIDMMFKETNGNTAVFYLFLYGRVVRYFMNESGLRRQFEEYVNPVYSYSDKTTIDDDIRAYVERNMMDLYYVDDIRLWVRGRKVGIHDSMIEDDYTTFLPYDNERKMRENLRKASSFSVRKLTGNRFDRCVTYNLKTGWKEDFGFSFTIKRI